MVLEPAVPSWLFDEEGTVSFTFLGHTSITYVQKDDPLNTWEMEKPKKAEITTDDGKTVKLDLVDGVIPAPYAEMTRSRLVSEITVYL